MNQISYIVKGVLLGGLIFIGVIGIKTVASLDLRITKESNSLAFCGTNDVYSRKSSSHPGGKMLFLANCASCHNLLKVGTGPALFGVFERGPWSDTSKLRAWIRNPSEFMKKDQYTRSLKAKYGSVMNAFPDLTDDQIDAIASYINAE